MSVANLIERLVSLPRCAQTESGLECIGDGHGGCGWHGCELSAWPKPCTYILDEQHYCIGYVLDENGEDVVCICPKCGGECAHTPLSEVQFPECYWDKDFVCECKQQANTERSD